MRLGSELLCVVACVTNFFNIAGYCSCGLHEPALGYSKRHRCTMGFYYTELLEQVCNLCFVVLAFQFDTCILVFF